MICIYSCNDPSVVETKIEKPTVSNFDKRLEEMNITLPKISSPIANYVNCVQTGKLLFLSGKGPKDEQGNYIKGKLGLDVSVENAYKAARQTGIMQLAALKDCLGDLSNVKRIVKVTGMVNATEDFTQHPEVVNGFSDLMVEVFGESGRHARAAIGMSSLPRNMVCEIEMIVEVK